MHVSQLIPYFNLDLRFYGQLCPFFHNINQILQWEYNVHYTVRKEIHMVMKME